ncbi:MAG: NADH-quinone oxidoreductase subunit L, partial [Actinomycetota bacterium]|nr:NADH-quinone oxidoreductase subunit L [Actinomycetota bacterium]
AGVPPFAGFWSKDEILLFTLARSPVLYVIGLVTAILTAYYMTRQVIMVFFGEAQWESQAEDNGAHGDFKPHESPPIMLFPLVVLSVLSVLGGIIQLPSFGIIPKGLRHRLEDWLHPVVAPGEAVISGTSAYDAKVWLALLAISCAVVGIALGVLVYGRRKLRAIEPAILADGWRYDRTVSAFMGGPGHKMFDAIAWFDAKIVDGAVNGVATAVRSASSSVRRIQTGNVRSYAGVIGIGVVLILMWFVVLRGVM